MIDLQNYNDKKEKGLVSLVKTDANPDNPDAVTYAIATKKFDPATGERLSDEVIGISKKEITDKIVDLQEELAEYQAFLAECEAL